jgi:hypothetical protein
MTDGRGASAAEQARCFTKRKAILLTASASALSSAFNIRAPSGRDWMRETCGEESERRVTASERYGFSNLATAPKETRRGTHRP